MIKKVSLLILTLTLSTCSAASSKSPYIFNDEYEFTPIYLSSDVNGEKDNHPIIIVLLDPSPSPVVKSTPAPKPAVKLGSIAAAKQYARNTLGQKSYNCLYALVKRESKWRVNATNRNSGAYGLPQALPGSKMARFGKDWRTNPITQLKWMIYYVNQRYDGACNALRHALTIGWY